MSRMWTCVSRVCKDQQHYKFIAAPLLLPPYRVCLYIKNIHNLQYKMCISIIFIQYHTIIPVQYVFFVALKSVWMQKPSHAACVCCLWCVLSAGGPVSCLTATVNVHWGCIETTDHQEGPHGNPLILVHSERQVKRASAAVEVTTLKITCVCACACFIRRPRFDPAPNNFTP